jgi:hypothetical protein
MPRQDPQGQDPSLKPAPAAAAPTSGRKDPHPRWADGAAPFTRLLNAQPDRKYVLVSKNDSLTIGKYLSLGYERETNRQDGPRFLYGESAAMGDFVETMDLILLSVSMEQYLDHYKYGGVDGAEGQQYFDNLENKIVDRVGDDATRGIHARRGWATQNETENAYVRHGGA